MMACSGGLIKMGLTIAYTNSMVHGICTFVILCLVTGVYEGHIMLS